MTPEPPRIREAGTTTTKLGYSTRPGSMFGGSLATKQAEEKLAPPGHTPGISPNSPQGLALSSTGVPPGFVPPTIQPGGLSYGKPADKNKNKNAQAPGLMFSALSKEKSKI